MSRFSLTLILLPLLAACTLADVQVNVVSERTSLENQVLGTYNSLSDEVLLVASVRGISPQGKIEEPPALSPEQQDAVEALQLLSFHADDLDSFKTLGWVGENRDGLLTPFSRDTKGAGDEVSRMSQAEFDAVVAEINTARELLMRRVIQLNETFTAADLPEIRRVFAGIQRQKSRSGTKVQRDDGSWGVK